MALPLSKAGRRYGYFPSVRRDTDKVGLPASLTLPEGLVLAPKLSIETWQPPVKDQGQQGSCTAHGSTSYREFLFRKYFDYEKSKAKFPDPTKVILSPSFVYYLERQTEGTLAQGDVGANVETSMLVMDKYGAPLLSDMPYDDSECNLAPTAAQLADALTFKGGAFHRILSVIDIKTCIASGYPITVGFNVYDSFEGDQIAKDGLMPMPDTSTETLQGGHEVFGGLAYDDSVQCPGANPGAVLMQNSWGTSWGIAGRFWMPYDFFTGSDPRIPQGWPSPIGPFVSDIWMEHLGSPWGKKTMIAR